LSIWAERVGAEIIRQKSGADPSAVAYDAVQAALNRAVDVVIVDTAGRLHTKHNPHGRAQEDPARHAQGPPRLAARGCCWCSTLTTGQNGIAQAKSFNEALGLTASSSPSSTARPRAAASWASATSCSVPIRFIGIGEQIDDLRPFVAQDFVNALFDREN
jgi:fused signal recognition particle receptor